MGVVVELWGVVLSCDGGVGGMSGGDGGGSREDAFDRHLEVLQSVILLNQFLEMFCD